MAEDDPPRVTDVARAPECRGDIVALPGRGAVGFERATPLPHHPNDPVDDGRRVGRHQTEQAGGAHDVIQRGAPHVAADTEVKGAFPGYLGFGNDVVERTQPPSAPLVLKVLKVENPGQQARRRVVLGAGSNIQGTRAIRPCFDLE